MITLAGHYSMLDQDLGQLNLQSFEALDDVRVSEDGGIIIYSGADKTLSETAERVMEIEDRMDNIASQAGVLGSHCTGLVVLIGRKGGVGLRVELCGSPALEDAGTSIELTWVTRS